MLLKMSQTPWNALNTNGIVSRDWKGLQMLSLDRFEIQRIPDYVYF
jgi:hypothetical protein